MSILLYQIARLIISIAFTHILMNQLFNQRLCVKPIIVQYLGLILIQIVSLYSDFSYHKEVMMIIFALLNLCLSFLIKTKISEVLYNEIILFFIFSFTEFIAVVLAYLIETII